MMIPSPASPEVFITASQQQTARPVAAVCLKPLVVAAVATLLFSFLIAYGCVFFASGFAAGNGRLNDQPRQLTVSQIPSYSPQVAEAATNLPASSKP